MLFGAHVSIAGGIDKSPQRAKELGCECFQIFTRSPRGGKPPELTDELVEKFHINCSSAGIENIYVHTPYYINLASSKDELRENSLKLVLEELNRSSRLNVKYVMTHIGSARDTGREEAVENVVDSLNNILSSYSEYTELLLENTAGQGYTLGITFEEIAGIIEKTESGNIGVCLDTAHMFASGYDIRTLEDIDNLVKIIENTITLDNVKLIHGNDSKADFNSNKDRHEHIGDGKIGKEGFINIIKNEYLNKVDMIVENPPDGVGKDIKLLKQIRDNF